jgi:hypothetical protein
VATKGYVDSQLKGPTSHYFKLYCGETASRELLFRDFFIPNLGQRFGEERNSVFVYFTVRHSPGDPTPCSIVRLQLDQDYLRIRFALRAPWNGKLSLYTRVDVLGADTNYKYLQHQQKADGTLMDWN